MSIYNVAYCKHSVVDFIKFEFTFNIYLGYFDCWRGWKYRLLWLVTTFEWKFRFESKDLSRYCGRLEWLLYGDDCVDDIFFANLMICSCCNQASVLTFFRVWVRHSHSNSNSKQIQASYARILLWYEEFLLLCANMIFKN